MSVSGCVFYCNEVILNHQGTSGDDTAANYMQVRCRKFETTNDGLPTYPGTGRGYWGTYGDWSVSCAAKTAVCGIQTRIESSLGSGRDDTALNDVKLYCCDWDLRK